jgi:hypothetical protein
LRRQRQVEDLDVRLVDHHPFPARVGAGDDEDRHLGDLAEPLDPLGGAPRIVDVQDDRVDAAGQHDPAVQRPRQGRADVRPERGQRFRQGLVARDDEDADRPIIAGRRH